jgi:hypothetical protein
MIGPAIVVLWFLVVAICLIRQWWVSELAQAPVGVPASEPVTLSTPSAMIAPAPVVSWGLRRGLQPR